ncbi:MAG: family 43 glycosylhydrolase [Propionibacteriaceae bacterium]|jgi:GH43 family beta-xylosidase|nr:family 43 glycosylhydrolase [Propionibacteriaceae bacterium]
MTRPYAAVAKNTATILALALCATWLSPVADVRADTPATAIASFSFDDATDGMSGAGAKATTTGTPAFAASWDGTQAASVSSGFWMSVTKDDDTGLLAGLDEITVSYDVKATTSGAGWTFYAAPSTTTQPIGGASNGEIYVGVLDKPASVTVERYYNGRASGANNAAVTGRSDTGWKHVDIVISNTATKLYLNGVLVEQSTAATPPALSTILGSSGGIIQLGKANWGGGEYFSGLLDNFTIYDGPLTDDEITAANAARDAVVFDQMAITVPATASRDLTLAATATAFGSAITWSSDHPEVIDGDGTFTLPAADTTVTLTAAVGGATRTFSVFVEGGAETAATPIADFSFDDETDGFAGAGAKAVPNGTVALADSWNGTQAADMSSDFWMNVVKADDSPLLAGVDELTVSYDVKLAASGNEGWTFFAAPSASTVTYQQEKYIGVIDTAAKLTAERYYNSGSRISTGNAAGALDNAGWKHVDLVVGPNATRLYVNGELLAKNSGAVADIATILGASGGVIQIGKANWVSGEYFKGLMDNLAIYADSLTAGQLADMQWERDKAALHSLGLDVPAAAADTFTLPALPAQTVFGAEIEWVSSHPAVVGIDGSYEQPLYDTAVTLTGTITGPGGTEAVTYPIAVTGTEPPGPTLPTPIAQFTFDDQTTGFSGAGAKATTTGTVSLADSWNGTQAASISSTFWLTVRKDDNSALLAGLEEITVSYDVKATSAGNGWTFYAANSTTAQTGGSERYVGIMDKPNSVTVERYYQGRSSGANNASVAGLAAADWKHVDLVITASATKLYVNGELVSTSTAGSPPALSTIMGSSGGILQIGKANWTSSGEFFQGLLDNYTIYGEALSGADIAAANWARDRVALTSLAVPTQVANNTVLPATSTFGSAISWATSDAAHLDVDGTVTRPAEGDPNAVVTLTATISNGSDSKSRNFTVTVLSFGEPEPAVTIANVCATERVSYSATYTEWAYYPKKSCDQNAATSWSNWVSGGRSADTVTYDFVDPYVFAQITVRPTERAPLTLAVEYLDAVTHEWTAVSNSNTSPALAINVDSVITFDPVTAKGIRLVMTMNSYAKIAEVVLGPVTTPVANAADRVQADLDAISFPYANDVRSAVTLPATGEVYGTAISWVSSDTSVITDTDADGKAAGMVNRQATDQTVTLTATAAYGATTASKAFTLTVKKAYTMPETTDYLFASFTGSEGSRTDEQIYFATSQDGAHFTDLTANGQPVLENNSGDRGTRDPYIVRSPEGDRVYMIATDLSIYYRKGWGSAEATVVDSGSTKIVVWESTDLAHWSEPRLVELAGYIPDAGMMWAPEAMWDDTTGQYYVYWATTSSATNTLGDATNVYISTTRDFYSFTEPKLWIDRANSSIIDTTMIKVGDWYYRASGDGQITIEKTKNPAAQTLGLNTTGTDQEWVLVGTLSSIFGNSNYSGSKLEGPEFFKYNVDDYPAGTYGLMADQYADGLGYLPFRTTNIASTSTSDWTYASDVDFGTLKKRHGTILPITATEYAKIQAYFSGAGDAEDATPAQALAIPSVVVEDLPATSMGEDIAWSFSTPGIVAADGKVTAPTSGSVTGTLTAVVGGETVTATVEITAKGGELATFVRSGEGDMLAYVDDRRADSLYVAAKPAGQTSWEALNRNQAVIAVKWNGSQSTNPNAQMGSPEIFRQADGTLGAVATANNAGTTIYVWDADDKNVFRNQRSLTVASTGVVRDAHVAYDAGSGKYKVYWRSATSLWFVSIFDNLNSGATPTDTFMAEEALFAAVGALPTGADTAQASSVALSQAEFDAFYYKYVDLQNTSVNTPLTQNLNVGDTPAALPAQVEMGYNDGSTKKLNVEWDAADLAAVDTNTPGVYEIKGEVQQDDYAYPFIAGRADPHMFYNEDDGYWYVTGSHYNQAYDGAISQQQSYRKLGLRRATTIEGLQTATEAIIYDPDSTNGVGYNYSAFIWAPEFHKINGKWWIVVGMQSTWSTNGNYPNATVIIPFTGDEDDVRDGKMLDASFWGTPIALNVGASWDVSYWEKNGQGYWISPPSGDMTFRVYKAQMGDGVTPLPVGGYSVIYQLEYPMHYGKDNWTATSEGTDHGVIEGPYIVELGDYLYLVYSMGTVDKYYALGTLMADKDADISDPAAWTAIPYVQMSSEDVSDGQIGGAPQVAAGHNSLVFDDAGNLMNVYHARPNPLPQAGASGAGGLFDPSRSIAINSVNVRADGTLELAITSDQEVAPANKVVEAYITVGSVTLASAITITGADGGTLTLPKGDTATLGATVAPADATVQDVTWSSSNPSVVSVTADGTLTANARGTAVITATAKDGSGVTASVTVTVPLTTQVDPLNPLLWYDFSDEAGNIVSDVTGNGHDGTIVGTPDWGDGTLTLNGQYIKLPDGLLAGKHDITISFDSLTNGATEAKSWVFYAAANTTAPTYQTEKYLAVEDMSNTVNVQRWVNTGSRDNTGNATAEGLSSGAWRHVDLVITDTYTKLYVDGQLLGQSTDTTGRTLPDILGASGGIIQLGKANWGSGEFYDGVLDNFKIYDRAMTQDDFLIDTGLYLDASAQILSDKRTTESGKEIVTLVLDQWALGGNVTGAVADKANVTLDFYVKEGSTLTLADGSPLPAAFDLTNPVDLKVTPASGSPVIYEVRAEVLVTPVRIPGLVDGTGVTGMKFFADPEVFAENGKYYIYPTTDGYSSWRGWQIHAFESTDLVTWVDKGVVIDLQDQNLDGTPDSSILTSRTQNAWAPAMAKRDGKYYLYFSGGGQSNVAISETSPYSGFVLQNAVVANSIDPDVFQDPADGKWYLAWGQSGIQYCELNDDMLSCKPGTTYTAAISGFREGSYLTYRDGIYYFSYSVNDTNDATYHVRYATATSMAGPWTYQGEVLNQDVSKGILGTGHHSVLQIPGTDDWYVVYHAFLNDAMRPRLTDTGTGSQIATGNKREVRIARLTYAADGSWNRIPVTYEGVLPETTPQVNVTGDESGMAAGTVLTAAFNEGWDGQTWQWYRDGSPITGATNASYTLTTADEGAEITVKGVAEHQWVLNNDGDGPSVTDEIEGVAGVGDTSNADDLLDAIVLPSTLAAGDVLPATSNDAAITWTVTSGSITHAGGAIANAPETGYAQVVLTATINGVSRDFPVQVIGSDHATLAAYTVNQTTRNVDDPELERSIHLAVYEPGGTWTALNSGAGVVFATFEGTSVTANGSKRFTGTPTLFRTADGGFGALAPRVQSDGTPVAADKGKVIVFTSPDGVTWTEVGLLELTTSQRVAKAEATWDGDEYRIVWTDGLNTTHLAASADLVTASDVLTGLAPATVARTAGTGISYANLAATLPITLSEAATLNNLLGRVRNTTIDAPADIEISQNAAVTLPQQITANYSDSGTHDMDVTWDLSAVDTSTPGVYTATGTLGFQQAIYPLIAQRADPTAFRYTDPVTSAKSWLFISTDDDGQDEFFIRQASTLAGIQTASDNRILGKGLCSGSTTGAQLWAPELHEVDGELYLLFAATPNCNNSWSSVQAYTMHLKTGQNPLLAASWETPQRVQNSSGGTLTTLGTSISLDMTHFRDAGKDYVVWSDRIISPSSPAVLKIGEVEVSATGAWKLKSEAKVLTVPDSGWDYNTDPVDEGPFAILRDGKIFITYSGSGVNSTYAVGLVSADSGADLLDVASWTKRTYPIWSNEGPITNNWGPGHNSYVYDDAGNLYNVFHAMATSSGTRDAGIRMVYFRADGSPILDMTDTEWLAAENRTVAVQVTVVAVDNSELADLVTSLSGIEPEDYSSSTWADFALALEAAEDVLADTTATQTQIDAAREALLTAVDALNHDVSVLAVLVAQAQALDASDYTAASWAALQTAIADAEEALEDPTLTHAAAASQADALLDAITSLVPRSAAELPNRNVLAGALAVAAAIITSHADYGQHTAGSYAQFLVAYTAAHTVMDSETATQADVDAALGALVTAIIGLDDNLEPFTKVGTPKISGTKKVGKVLKVSSYGSWTPKPYAYGYQWYRDGLAIAGANSSSYELVAADRGKRITVRVIAKLDDYQLTYSNSSKKTSKIGYGTLTAKTVVQGTAANGQTLIADTSAWTAGTTLTYQWYRNSSKIAGAVADSYTLTDADLGKTIKVKVTGVKDGYKKKSQTSAKTAKVAKFAFTVTPDPVIQGTPTVGSALSVDVGVWTPTPSAYSYQWYANGKAISKATKSSYTPSSKYAGKQLTVKVTGKLADHATVALVSAPVTVA